MHLRNRKRVMSLEMWFVALFSLILSAENGRSDDWGEWKPYRRVNNIWLKKCDTSSHKCECNKSEGTRLGCAYITIGTGPVRPGSSFLPGLLRILATDPSPALSTPQMLQYVAGYGIQSVSGEKTAGGAPSDVYVIDPDATMIQFRFEDGESVGAPFAAQSTDKARLLMVDPEGWAVTNEPAYYDLYPGNGDVYRFAASTNASHYLQLVLYKSASGREETTPAEALCDDNGVIRQVMAASWLVDIVVSNGYRYDVKSYLRADLENGKNPQGFYVPKTNADPFKIWIVENPEPGNNNNLRVTEVIGSSSNVSDFAYTPAAGEWMLTKGGGLRVETDTSTESSADQSITMVNAVRDGAGNVLSCRRVYFAMFPWGPSRTGEVEDPDGLALTTEYAYYQNPSETGRYSKLQSETLPDGSWKTYDYNAQARMILEIAPWKDSPFGSAANEAHATYYDYAPVDSRDTGVFNDQRPRTVTEKILGITVTKTYHAYAATAAGEYIEVEEKCIDPNAAYGASSNLRTLETYYSASAGAQLVGRLKSVQRPDGQLDTYLYEYGNYIADVDPAACRFQPDPLGGAFRTTVIHGTTNSSDGIVNKTTKETTVVDSANNEALTETYVYTGSTNYERIKWEVKEFNVFGHPTKTYRSNGETEDASWGCCGKDNETDAYGAERTFSHDALGRLSAETKLGTNSPLDDLITSYTYDAADRQLTQTISGGGLSLMTSNEYDVVGRLLKTTDPAMLITRHEYINGGRAEWVTRPGGATEITEKYLDGQIRSSTGTAVVQQFYDYGVNFTGSRWTMVHTGATNSPMWEKTTVDIMGRTIHIEKPGFLGVETNKFAYDLKGRLVKQTQPGMADTLFGYDELGNPVRNGLDVNRNGTLDLASMDRINETDNRYALIGTNWWQETQQKVYATDNSSLATTTAVQKVRLIDLGGSPATVTAASVTVTTDVLGNEIVVTTSIDRDLKQVTRTTTYPDSTNAAVEVAVNGLLQSRTIKTGIQSTFAYDALERQMGVSDPRTGMSVSHYNNKGQIDYTEDSAGNRTSYTYDPDTGQRISHTDAMTNSVFYAYDSRGQLVGAWGATYPVLYDYDDYGRTIALYTLRDNAIATNTSYSGFRSQGSDFDKTTWSYDLATGLLTNKIYVDSSSVSYSYGPAGQLARRTWARGLTTAYSYDAAGSLTNINYSDSTPDVSFAYDRLGRQQIVTDSAGIRSFYFGNYLQLTSELSQVSGFTSQVSRSYDLLGRSSGLSISNYAVSYGYDSVGRFSSISSFVNFASFVVNYSYLPGSDLLMGYTNTSGLAVERVYEPHRDLLAAISNRWNGSLVSSFAYTNDALGRRTRRVDSGSRANNFGYNGRSELANAILGANQYGYTYDPIGNREWTRMNANTNWYTANELNQYLSVTSAASMVNLSYDPDGNLTNYNGWTFAWDAENRLIAAENATRKVENAYDYMSRRIEKKVYSWATDHWSLITDHSFLYDGWNLIRETQVSGFSAQVSRFVWGLDLSGTLQAAGGIGGLLCASLGGPGSPSTVFYSFDANGNVTDLVSTNGVLAAHYDYDPFGEVICQTGPEAANMPFGFSTRYTDRETGLVMFPTRPYSPTLGRFLTHDPIEELGGNNLYAFVANDPVNAIDPLGWEQFTSITVKRKTVNWISLLKMKLGKKPAPDDPYGHWWLEFDSESYGWWPKNGVTLIQTLKGVPGQLNGTDDMYLSGISTATKDGHQGDPADDEFHPQRRTGFMGWADMQYGTAKNKSCKCVTQDEVKDCLRAFAKQYSGSWSYPWGQNCHSFQTSAMKGCCLKK
jgi:RHS repeat-associated protein